MLGIGFTNQPGVDPKIRKAAEKQNELLEQQNELVKEQMNSTRKRANWSLVISLIALACSIGILIFNWLNYSK